MSRRLALPWTTVFYLAAAGPRGALEAGPNVVAGADAAAGTSAQTPADAKPGGTTPAPSPPQTFGDAALSIVTVGAFDWTPADPRATWQPAPGRPLFRYLTANESVTGGELDATLHLPSGARVEKIELEACDTTPSGQVVAGLAAWSVPAGPGALQAFVETGTGEAPGCAVFASALASPLTIDNRAFQYNVAAVNNTYDGSTLIGAVRVYYRLQVSPAPSTATFADVPADHLYFRAIEALAASGITGGCGGGNFCPDQSVTRGELAAFFARALGLHWPN